MIFASNSEYDEYGKTKTFAFDGVDDCSDLFCAGSNGEQT